MSERASGQIRGHGPRPATERWLPMPLWSLVELKRRIPSPILTVHNAVVPYVCANFYERAP